MTNQEAEQILTALVKIAEQQNRIMEHMISILTRLAQLEYYVTKAQLPTILFTPPAKNDTTLPAMPANPIIWCGDMHSQKNPHSNN